MFNIFGMIRAREIKVIDANSEFYGVSTTKLMEAAGKSVANFIEKISKCKKIVVFCGTGNNGGDGFVAARHLSKKFDVSVFLTAQENKIRTELSKNNFKKLKKLNVEIFNDIAEVDRLISECNVIVDAMLGIGISGNLREPYKTIVEEINSSKNKKIIAVDIPTGFGTNISTKSHYTLTFHDQKEGMNKKNSGEIMIVNIGVPKKATEYVGSGELLVLYPKPKKESHKGDNGRVLVIGGGPYLGAPAMTGLSALRTGSDLVYIVAPKKVARAITSYSALTKPKKLAKNIALKSPNLIVKELSSEDMLIKDDAKIIEEFIGKVDTIVIGPGLGTDKKTQDAIKEILIKCKNSGKSIVIDADAIQVAGENKNIIKNLDAVITPHAGEFKKLTGVKLSNSIKERKNEVEKWANKLGVTILLKGATDIISNGKETKLNDIHNEAMTVGGTGDVLAGIVGSLLSKGLEPFDAARVAIFINGTAGNFAFEKKSYGLIATDIIEEIPNVLKKYL